MLMFNEGIFLIVYHYRICDQISQGLKLGFDIKVVLRTMRINDEESAFHSGKLRELRRFG